MTETHLSVVNNGSQQYVEAVVDNEGNCSLVKYVFLKERLA